ncbi:MAG: choice-of-anchor D domain-containing protein [Prevotella sp.]|nr:choice-of-anchor D domain-containing protein [Prevotella sp.]
MKKTYLMFALLLSLMGVNGALADTVTDDFSGYTTTTSGTTLGDNWVILPGSDGSWGAFGSNKDYVHYNEYGEHYVAGNSNNNYSKGVWLVLRKQVTGTVTFTATNGNSSSSFTIYVSKANASGDTYAVTGTASSYSVPSRTSSAKTFTFDAGSTPTYVAFCLAGTSKNPKLQSVTYDEVEGFDGPSLIVSGDTDGALNFGMVNPGATKTLTLSNPGTESITVNIATTGGFTANPTSATIAAGEQQTLTISAPEATATGKVTITPNPAVEGIAPVEIALSCVVKDPSKVFVDFSGNALPTAEGWEDYAGSTSYAWSYANGYASNTGGTYYEKYLASPAMIFEDGETLMFDAAGNSSWEPNYGSSYAGSVTVKFSPDGTTFSGDQTFSGLKYNTWQSCSVNVPAGTKYVRFYVDKYANIDNIYGGKYDETPTPKLAVEGIANGGSLSWGYADVPAGSTKTITLKNDGTADLDVTIAATDDYTVDPAAATVEANGGTVAVTIGTPAHDGNGVLTITPAEGSGLSPYTINLTSYYKEPKPVMAIDKTAIAFGRVNEVKTETVTVSNSGDADLVATIANDNTENFTVSTESLTVAPGETGTFTVTYNYAEGTWGTFTANIKVTPNYGSTYDVKTITASATSKDPNVWEEDSEAGIPSEWTNSGWTISRKWSEESSVNHAYSGTSNSNTLVTPRLFATEGAVLEFEVIDAEENYPLTVEYSSDMQNWTEYGKITESGTATFTAPAEGAYYLRFSGRYIYLDNFSGFKLDLLAADVAISASTLPATGNQFVAYNASVTVENKGTEAQVAVAKLLVNGEEKASDEAELAVAASATIDLSFVPEEAITDGTATIEVTLKDVEDFAAKTVEATINIAAAPVIDETAENSFTTGTLPVAVLNYTAKNGWNTIGVPFQLTNDILTTIFGEGWKAYELTGYSNSEISFSQTTNFVAGYPYIIYAEAAPQEASFKLENLNISSATEKEDVRGGLAFRSTFAPIAPGQLTEWWGVTNQGRIQPAGSGASLKALRGYFYTNAEAPDTNLSEARIVYINLDGTVTAISSVKAQLKADGNTYDLSGRKLTGNLKQGVYIQNGKKIVIK